MSDGWQQRVRDEQVELNRKYESLKKFKESPEFSKLDLSEQGRLKEQSAAMYLYNSILLRRIAAF